MAAFSSQVITCAGISILLCMIGLFLVLLRNSKFLSTKKNKISFLIKICFLGFLIFFIITVVFAQLNGSHSLPPFLFFP